MRESLEWHYARATKESEWFDKNFPKPLGALAAAK
jgi:hypothetical protein